MTKRDQMRGVVKELNYALDITPNALLKVDGELVLCTSGMSASCLSLPLWAVKIRVSDAEEMKTIPWLDQVTCAELLERGDALIDNPEVLREVVHDARNGVIRKEDLTPLPDWCDIDEKLQRGVKLDPLERFIHSHEPADPDQNETFTKQLSELIEYVKNS